MRRTILWFSILLLVVNFVITGCWHNPDPVPEPDPEPVASSSIVGSWGDGVASSNVLSLTFYPDGTYIHWEKNNEGSGVEYGTYTYDAGSLTLTAISTVDENADASGLTGYASVATVAKPVTVDGDTITFPNNDGTTTSFSRVVDDDNPIVGSWEQGNIQNWVVYPSDKGSLTFYANGTYIEWEDADTDCDHTGTGVEYGTYTYDADSKTLTVKSTIDENGDCGGLTNAAGQDTSIADITVSGDVMTFEHNDDKKMDTFGKTDTFKRVKSNDVNITAHSSNDLSGTWYDVGISTPVINTNDSANFGYDVDKAVLSKGSGTFTPISSSDSLEPDTGTLTINSDGVVSDGDPTNSFIFMNKNKNMMVQVFKNDDQAMFAYVKKASSYSSADLSGTWYSVGIKNPAKNTNNSTNFGYDVDTAVLENGTGTFTPISSSDSLSPSSGTLTINSDGVISDGDPNSFIYMNESKDVMIQLFKDDATQHQAMFVYVKKAASYSAADLSGTWYSVGIKTPAKNTDSSANFGYDVDKAVLSKGSGTFTPISSSDSLEPDTGTLTINSDGVVSDGDPTNSFIFMNASKDVMIQLYKDDVTHHHAMFIYVKKNGA